ncbi:hypothetical protein [Halapricum desulfuricans]|uniref:hypothetical protein n=1 Tax=Halapricum desulfuricans TaxID=2841257 RepID=UPI001E57B7E9|nr:hypothetical protein [Halapricum desulfuricans]
MTQFTNDILDQFAENEYYSGPTNKQELLTSVSNNAGIELSGASTAAGFGKYAGSETATRGPYYGLYFEADWSPDEVVNALESGGLQFTEGEYSGQTLYEAGREYQPLWLGVAGDDAYVLATEIATKDTLDVSAGNMDSVGGEMSNAFSAIRDAPFKFVAEMPTNQLPESGIEVGGSSIDPKRFATVTHVTGIAYHEDDTAGITLTFLTGGSGDAEDVANALRGVIAAAAERTQNETVANAMNDTSINTDKSTVVVEASGSVDRATRVITAIFGLLFGL